MTRDKAIEIDLLDWVCRDEQCVPCAFLGGCVCAGDDDKPVLVGFYPDPDPEAYMSNAWSQPYGWHGLVICAECADEINHHDSNLTIEGVNEMRARWLAKAGN
jgi:hypothetical protein